VLFANLIEFKTKQIQKQITKQKQKCCSGHSTKHANSAGQEAFAYLAACDFPC